MATKIRPLFLWLFFGALLLIPLVIVTMAILIARNL
jgi:hypothetical protein